MQKIERGIHVAGWLLALASLGIIVVFSAPARAASSYPSRPIDIVVGFGPGGAADVAARLVATYVSKKWDQPINVVNMPGASGIIGTRHVLVAKPDGYTLMMDNHAVSAMLAATQMDLPFKWDNRTPIALVTLDPVFYTTKLDAPWKNLKELAEHVRKNPKVLRYGTAGVTALGAFSVPQFLDANQLPLESMNKVVFKSGGEAMTAVAGGHVDFAGQQYSESTGLILAKKVKALAVVNAERLAGRISSILGADGPEREDICKRFEELYRFRSDLVHGNQFKEEVYAGHLRDARDFARKTLLWFLNCFSAIQAAIPEENSSSFPNCEDVLLLLDIKQETRIRLTKLVGRLPEHFPQVPEWLQ